MKRTYSNVWYRVSVVAAVCLAASGIAQAKGYSPTIPAANADSQEIEKRLSRIEDHQQRMEDALTAELRKLQTEVDAAKAQHIVKSSVESDD